MTLQEALDKIVSKLQGKMNLTHPHLGISHFKKDPLVTINGFAKMINNKDYKFLYKKLDKHEQNIIKLSHILKQNQLINSLNVNALNSLWVQSGEATQDAVEELMVTLETDYFYRDKNSYEISQEQFVDLVDGITESYRRSPYSHPN